VVRRRSRAVASRPASSANRLWAFLNDSWLFNHYKAGFVSTLLVLDVVALAMCLKDYNVFTSAGLNPVAALRVAIESLDQSGSLKSAVLVFVFFLVAPFAVGLVPHFFLRGDKRREAGARRATSTRYRVRDSKNETNPALKGWQRLLLTRGWWVIVGHFALALVVSAFTLLAQSMQILSGWRGQAPNYSFTSYWMWVVGAINWLYSGIMLPVFLKFFARSFGQERPRFGEVLREVTTELPAER
jgi:hypothetical protein